MLNLNIFVMQMDMNIKTLSNIPCSAQTAFDAWLSEKDHKAMVSDHPDCKFDVKEGGKWQVGSLEGDFIKIDKKDLKIVMNWRYTEGWDDNEYSKLTVDFDSTGENTCKVKLLHTNVPDDLADEIKQGWKEYYFEGMKSYFSK